MAKTMTFRNLIAAFLFLASTLSVSAQFWSESFGSQAAFNAWTAASTGMGAEVWNWSTATADPMGFAPTAPTAFASPTSSTGFAFFNSDANGDGNTHDVTLTSGTINCASHTSVGLRFHSQFADFTGSTAQVRVSTDGGTTWTAYDVFDNSPSYGVGQGALVPADVVTEIGIPAANSQANVRIQFRWEGFWEYGWKLDDIELYDFSAPIHDVTFKVNASLLTVDPGGMRIAGTFTNWADQVMTNDGGGIWSVTIPLEEGSSHQYKFKNGSGGWEAGQAACGVNDGNGGFNRTLTVGSEDLTLPAVCFNSCDPCVVPCALNPNKIVCDNMETYITTQKLAQQNVAQNGAANSWFSTWSGTTGTTEDGIITTEQANSGTKSFKIVSTATAGGPQDVVLKLGNKTTGRYELKWMYYIPVGKQAYYNIQNVVPIGAGAWNLDVFFGANNEGHTQIGAGPVLSTFTYPSAEWFEVKQVVDLDNNLLTLWVDGQYVTKMAYPNNLGGIDFYGIDNNHQNYVDDVEYVSLPPLVYNVDVCDAAVDLTLYFGQAVTQTTGLYDNTSATVSPSDPAVDCWGETTGADFVDGSMWYTFVGDGKEYHIETVPCNATNYIGTVQQDPGDTQMLVYAGDNCSDLTEIACNDDLYPTGTPDWRSAVDLETVVGQNYYMLIDGFNFSGTVALGQFCIEISQVPSIVCADGAAGTYETSSLYLCEGAQLADLITLDPSGFVIPNEGPVFGLAWAITSEPIPANVWPRDQAGLLVGSTGFLADPFVVGYVNDGDPFPANLYYITPIVLGGGTDTAPADGATLFDTEVGNGCFFSGVSVPVLFLPLTDDVTATATTGSGSVNLTPGGGIGALIGDETPYIYQWSNGATTQDLTNVAAGTYTCTVSDACSAPAVVTVQVTVGTTDPSSIQSFVVSPNPTSGIVKLSLALATAADVRIEVLNTLGQTLQTLNAGKMSNLSQNVDLSSMAQGSYFLRVTVDGETAIRRVVVQR